MTNNQVWAEHIRPRVFKMLYAGMLIDVYIFVMPSQAKKHHKERFSGGTTL